MPPDFWGVVFPNYLAACGALLGTLIAGGALWVSILSYRKSGRAVADGVARGQIAAQAIRTEQQISEVDKNFYELVARYARDEERVRLVSEARATQRMASAAQESLDLLLESLESPSPKVPLSKEAFDRFVQAEGRMPTREEMG